MERIGKEPVSVVTPLRNFFGPGPRPPPVAAMNSRRLLLSPSCFLRHRAPGLGWHGWHEWHGVSLARLTLDNQEWEVRAGQVYLVRRGELLDRTYWLIVARNLATGEVKYFISNAPADTPVEKLLRVAFSRWNVEHTFRVAKSEIGFGHFEGRSYVPL